MNMPGSQNQKRMQMIFQQKGVLMALLCSFIFAIRLCLIKSTPVKKAETLLFYRFFLTF